MTGVRFPSPALDTSSHNSASRTGGVRDTRKHSLRSSLVTERKPPGVSWETWVDRQIREGMERGDFDRLEGHGRPISGLDRPHDELWWVREKLRREGVSFLPPAPALRKDLEHAREAILRPCAAARPLLDRCSAELVAARHGALARGDA